MAGRTLSGLAACGSVLVPAREQVCESRAAHATAIAAASAAHARTRQGAAAWASSTARSRPIGLHARAELVRYARASCDAHGCMLLVSRLVWFVMCVRLAVSYPNRGCARSPLGSLCEYMGHECLKT